MDSLFYPIEFVQSLSTVIITVWDLLLTRGSYCLLAKHNDVIEMENLQFLIRAKWWRLDGLSARSDLGAVQGIYAGGWILRKD